MAHVGSIRCGFFLRPGARLGIGSLEETTRTPRSLRGVKRVLRGIFVEFNLFGANCKAALALIHKGIAWFFWAGPFGTIGDR